MTQEKWIFLKNYKICDGSLWEVVDTENPLSELIEMSELRDIGVECGRHIYLCDEPVSEIKELMCLGFLDDDHVYISKDDDYLEHGIWVWPY